MDEIFTSADQCEIKIRSSSNTLCTKNFGGKNFGGNIFGGTNFGELLPYFGVNFGENGNKIRWNFFFG